jgi:hypothetical protein
METGWPPPELLVTVSITSGMRSRPTRAIKVSSLATSMLPLKGMIDLGAAAFGMTRSTASAPYELDIGAGSVKVGVVGDYVAFLAHDVEEDALGGAALVRGDHVLVAENVLHGIAKLVEAAAAGVALIAFHDGGPLVGRHGAGAGVGE